MASGVTPSDPTADLSGGDAAPTTVGRWMAAEQDLDRRDREVLLCHAAGLSRAQLMAHPEHRLEADALDTLEHWVRRLRDGEPVAYLLGEKEFWGLTFSVTPAVLVPRPESELLVEVTLHALGAEPWPSVRVLELGTGSGAVAIALAREAAAAEANANADQAPADVRVQITACDVSAEALAVAEANGRRHGVAVRWLLSDWFRGVNGSFHLIVANPPYVREGDPHLHALRHEPRQALLAGADGLDAIRAIAAAAPAHLEPGGLLALEHGHDQGDAVRILLERAGLVDVHTCHDLAGRDRVTRARRPEIHHES